MVLLESAKDVIVTAYWVFKLDDILEIQYGVNMTTLNSRDPDNDLEAQWPIQKAHELFWGLPKALVLSTYDPHNIDYMGIPSEILDTNSKI